MHRTVIAPQRRSIDIQIIPKHRSFARGRRRGSKLYDRMSTNEILVVDGERAEEKI